MKVFITVDLEGISGWVQSDPAERQRERELLTADANAAIAGAFDGGADEVLVTEAHGNMRNLIPENVDRRATFLSGAPKPQNHMVGMDSSFNAAMLVGYHSKAGTKHGVMAHTYRSTTVYALRFNGVEVGEIGTDAAIAGYYKVPVVLVAGDKAACNEARNLLGEIETVAVKEGVSRHAARCLPLEEAHRLIREGARTALRRTDGGVLFQFDPPIRTEVAFINPTQADAVSYLPFVERLDGCNIRFVSDDFLKAFELFDALYRLASSYQ